MYSVISPGLEMPSNTEANGNSEEILGSRQGVLVVPLHCSGYLHPFSDTSKITIMKECLFRPKQAWFSKFHKGVDNVGSQCLERVLSTE